MKKIIGLILLGWAGLGLGSPTLTLSKQQLSQFSWQSLNPNQVLNTTISSQEAGYNQITSNPSPIMGYRIPANQGTISLSVASLVSDKQVFMPNINVYNQQFELIKQYAADQFQYLAEQGLQPNRLALSFSFTPLNPQDYLYFVVYTREQDLQTQTTIPHPAKLYAKAKGNQAPAINDILLQHSLTGKLAIQLKLDETHQFVGLPALFNQGTNKTSERENRTSAKSVTQGLSAQHSSSVQKETLQYFEEAVKGALARNDIDKALNLVNEAERLGLTSPREIFIRQLKERN